MADKARVVLHLPERFMANYEKRGHLAIHARLRDVVTRLGGEVETRIRLGELTRRDPEAHVALLEPENLHIIENGAVRLPNALNATLAYLKGQYHLNARGVLAETGADAVDFDPRALDRAAVNGFWSRMQRRFVEPRRSRYGQARDVTHFEAGAIAVFLQSTFPHKRGTANCTDEEMLRAVAAGAGGRRILVKLHPFGERDAEEALVARLVDEGLALEVTEANVHDILRDCAVTVSYNSAAAIEGFLHRKPAILFGRADFAPACVSVGPDLDFAHALREALKPDGGLDYPAWLYWYFDRFTFSIYDPELDRLLMSKLSESGYPLSRLTGRVLARGAGDVAPDLAATLHAAPGMDEVEFRAVRRETPECMVVEGDLNGTPALVQAHRGDDAMRTATALEHELAELRQRAPQVADTLSDVRERWPALGILVFERPEGPTLDRLLRRARRDVRLSCFAAMGAWLAAYAAPRLRQASFAPRFWFRSLADGDAERGLGREGEQARRGIVRRLQTGCRELPGVAVSHATVPLLVAPEMFHQGPDGLICSDPCEVASHPVARTIAHSFVERAVRHGLDAETREAFLRSGVIDAEEADVVLRFFELIFLHRLLVGPALPEEQHRRLLAEIDLHLSD